MTDVTAALSVALNNDLQELRAISQNLANVSTNGYKREVTYVTAFQRVLDERDPEIAANPDKAQSQTHDAPFSTTWAK